MKRDNSTVVVVLIIACLVLAAAPQRDPRSPNTSVCATRPPPYRSGRQCSLLPTMKTIG